jgi:tyrosyl-tRNA synthetase
MSQSVGNYIGIDDPPDEMFGKTMSIPDAVMPQWFTLASGLEWEEIRGVVSDLGADRIHPGRAKRRLARSVVDLYHGAGAGAEAEVAFDRQFVLREVPDDIPTYPLPPGDPETAVVYLPALLAAAGLVASNSEGRRMLAQGAVRIDGQKETRELISKLELLSGVHAKVVSVGKRRFVRLGESPLQQPRA